MSLVAQNMKKGPDAAGIAEKGSGSAKHDNGTQRKICPGSQNMKTRLDERGTNENGSGSAKYENGTQRLRYRRKRLRERKT
jgi:hypothetical protein